MEIINYAFVILCLLVHTDSTSTGSNDYDNPLGCHAAPLRPRVRGSWGSRSAGLRAQTDAAAELISDERQSKIQHSVFSDSKLIFFSMFLADD